MEHAILPMALGAKYAKKDLLSLRFKSFLERPGGNFCWQGPKNWLLCVHEKATIYIPSAELKVFHYTKQ